MSDHGTGDALPTVLTLTLAEAIGVAVLNEAHGRGLQPLSVVVLDAGGHPIVLKRQDGASTGRSQIATAKASGCLAMGSGGRTLAQRAQVSPAFVAALNGIIPNGVLPVPGGVLVRDHHGRLLGAVGVSGDTADNDEVCAIAGIQAAGQVADAGALV